MAYTDDEKTAFADRVAAVKEKFSEKRIKYYAPIALALDSSANPKRLNNVMNGTQQHEASLLLLERIAGIAEPVTAAA